MAALRAGVVRALGFEVEVEGEGGVRVERGGGSLTGASAIVACVAAIWVAID